MSVLISGIILSASLALAVAYSPRAMNHIAAWLRARAFAMQAARAEYQACYAQEYANMQREFGIGRAATKRITGGFAVNDD
jgi:hypothetical protein